MAQGVQASHIGVLPNLSWSYTGKKVSNINSSVASSEFWVNPKVQEHLTEIIVLPSIECSIALTLPKPNHGANKESFKPLFVPSYTILILSSPFGTEKKLVMYPICLTFVNFFFSRALLSTSGLAICL